MTQSSGPLSLPAGVRVFERGWLSANGILIQGKNQTVLVDSGYATHSQQILALVKHALADRPLDLLLNTHLHSDHCGGNAALQSAFPTMRTRIPPGLAQFVRKWDPVALTYTPTGQQCPRFRFDGLLLAGEEIVLGGVRWQIHAAPGHDPHSVVLFEPATRTLISADALWENGFGVVFEELEGVKAFDEVSATLDLIELLAPRTVIPGHGRVFTGVDGALSAARSKLAGFVRDPRKHARHAAKVLLKFKLLEVQQIPSEQFTAWATSTAYFSLVHERFFNDLPLIAWIAELVTELAGSGAVRRDGDQLLNA